MTLVYAYGSFYHDHPIRKLSIFFQMNDLKTYLFELGIVELIIRTFPFINVKLDRKKEEF